MKKPVKPKKELNESKHKKKKKESPSEDDMEKAENELAKQEVKEPVMPAANTAEETENDA